MTLMSESPNRPNHAMKHKLYRDSAHRFQSSPLHKTLVSLVSLAFPQGVGELLQGASDQLRLLPQVGSQEAVGVGNGGEGSLEGVLEGLGGTGG
jgi:hypothetical protein